MRLVVQVALGIVAGRLLLGLFEWFFEPWSRKDGELENWHIFIVALALIVGGIWYVAIGE